MFLRSSMLLRRSSSSTTRFLAAGAAGLLISVTVPTSGAFSVPTGLAPQQQKQASSSFRFGIIADVQWADAEDGYNYAKTVKRCYRGAFQNLVRGVDWWNALDDKPIFIAQLGDLIDGVNAKLGDSRRVLKLALEQLDRAPCPSVNLVGNHELYNLNRQEMAEATWLKHGDKEYYSFNPAKGWRMIVLDPYQIALIGHAQDDPRRQKAVELMARENPNISPDGAAGNWFEGMEQGSSQRRFVPYNGGFGQEQLEWLQGQLEEAAASKERVVLMSHVIIHPQACGGSTMAWDYPKAMELIQSINKDQEVVVAVLCGHDHSGNYHYDDETGVHHCTFSSPLNKGSDGFAYGLMEVTPSHLEIIGPKVDDLLPQVNRRPATQQRGDLESILLPLRGCASVKQQSASASSEGVLSQ